MRVAIIGQQDFGRATLEAFLARGDVVAAVFCEPDRGRPDALKVAAEAAGVPVFQFSKMTAPEAKVALREAQVDIGVMAFVTQFVPQDFTSIPRLGTIQFHPSVLPAHRGASSMSWAIILGKAETGFSIFRPVDGLDEGPVLLTRAVPIGPDDTLGSLYFGTVFPMGVAGLVEAAELVAAGKLEAVEQPAAGAGYEGIIGAAESRISWANHVDVTYNLIRGCNPAPGAWTSFEGRTLHLFDCAKRVAGTFGAVKGKKIGQVVAVEGDVVSIHGQGGFIDVRRVRWEGGKKVTGGEAGLVVGAVLG